MRDATPFKSINPCVGIAVAAQACVDGAADGVVFWRRWARAANMRNGKFVGVRGAQENFGGRVGDSDERVGGDGRRGIDAGRVKCELTVGTDASEPRVVEVVQEAFKDAAATKTLLGRFDVGKGENNVGQDQIDKGCDGQGSLGPECISRCFFNMIHECLWSAGHFLFFICFFGCCVFGCVCFLIGEMSATKCRKWN